MAAQWFAMKIRSRSKSKMVQMLDAVVQVDASDIDSKDPYGAGDSDEPKYMVDKEISRLEHRHHVRQGYCFLGLHSLFLILTCLIVYMQLRPQEAFTVETGVKKTLAKFESKGVTLDKVDRLDEILTWLCDCLAEVAWPLPNANDNVTRTREMYPDGYKNGLRQDRSFLAKEFNIISGQGVLLGGALLKQTRYAYDDCNMPLSLRNLLAYYRNNTRYEMRCIETQPMTKGLYRSRADLVALLEKENTYSAINETLPMNIFLNAFEYTVETKEMQGYFFYLPSFLDHEEVDAAISYLNQYLWANFATREIVVYIPVFSVNLRRFVFCSVIFQQDLAGNWMHTVDTHSIRMDLYYESIPLIRACLEILFCVIVFGIFLKEVHAMWEIGLRAYFGDPFNYVDLMFIGFAVASVALWLNIVFMLDDLLLAATNNASMEVLVIGQYLRRLTEFYSVNVCVMVVFLFLRGLQFIGFQPKLSQFNRTIVAAAGPLTNFSVIFCFLFIGLSFIAYISFGHASHAYYSLPVSLMTSFNMLLTGGDWTGLLTDIGESSVGQTLVYIYYVCFNLFCTWIMINMFLAIVLMSYDSVSKESQEAIEGEISIDSTVMDDVRMLCSDAGKACKRSFMTLFRMRGKKRQRLEEGALPPKIMEDVVRRECLYFREFPESAVLTALKSLKLRYSKGITRDTLFKELSEMLAPSDSQKKLVLRRPKTKKRKGRHQGDDDASSSHSNLPPAQVESVPSDLDQLSLLKQKPRSDDLQRADSAMSTTATAFVTPRGRTQSAASARPAGGGESKSPTSAAPLTPAPNPQPPPISPSPSATDSANDDPISIYSNMGIVLQPNPAALYRNQSMRGRARGSASPGPLSRRETSSRGRRLSTDSTDSMNPLRAPDPPSSFK